MGFVAFLIEERGAKTSGAALSVEEPVAPDEFSRAVDDLVSRKALDDPETAQMIAAHFAEVVINKYLADDEATAHKAANALISVLGQPYVLVKATSLRGDVEITSITKIDAGSLSEAEAVWAGTLERMLSGETEH